MWGLAKARLAVSPRRLDRLAAASVLLLPGSPVVLLLQDSRPLPQGLEEAFPRHLAIKEDKKIESQKEGGWHIAWHDKEWGCWVGG